MRSMLGVLLFGLLLRGTLFAAPPEERAPADRRKRRILPSGARDRKAPEARIWGPVGLDSGPGSALLAAPPHRLDGVLVPAQAVSGAQEDPPPVPLFDLEEGLPALVHQHVQDPLSGVHITLAKPARLN